MINSIEILGLNVERTYPEPNTTNINVNSVITVKFNAEINTSTLVDSFTVLSDNTLSFTNSNSLKNTENFTQIKGSLTYKNCSLEFTPSEPLKKDTRYLICVKANGVKDVTGKAMLVDYIGMFYTELTASLPGCTITSPTFGSIFQEIPSFSWADQKTKCYSFQVSKQVSFELLLCDVLVTNKTLNSDADSFYTPSLSLSEGLYYARVRAINGDWGEPLQFFIKDSTRALVSNEDTAEGILFSDVPTEIEVIDMFPHENDCNVDTKVNIIYLKVRGQVEAKYINFNDCFVVGDLVDQDEADTVVPHGYLQGEWTVVYDGDEDVTYVIFTPVELGVTV